MDGRPRTMQLVLGAAVIVLVIPTICLDAWLIWRRASGGEAEAGLTEMRADPVDRRGFLERRERATGTNLSDAVSGAREPQWPLYWIMTFPANERSRCREIAVSWGRLVPPDSLVFIGTARNGTSDWGHRFVALDAPPESKSRKELLAWRFVVEAFPQREWYVKGDDDTLFVVGNLNRYLEEFDPRLPYFLGCKFHLGGGGGVQYVSGGGGYVLSRVAARQMAAITPQCLRRFGNVSEGDIAVSECLQAAGVVPEDTRDGRGRQRFHAFPYEYHVNYFRYGFHKQRVWYHKWVWGPIVEGDECCSDDTTVSFHYMSGRMRTFRWPPTPRRRTSPAAAPTLPAATAAVPSGR